MMRGVVRPDGLLSLAFMKRSYIGPKYTMISLRKMKSVGLKFLVNESLFYEVPVSRAIVKPNFLGKN